MSVQFPPLRHVLAPHDDDFSEKVVAPHSQVATYDAVTPIRDVLPESTTRGLSSVVSSLVQPLSQHCLLRHSLMGDDTMVTPTASSTLNRHKVKVVLYRDDYVLSTMPQPIKPLTKWHCLKYKIQLIYTNRKECLSPCPRMSCNKLFHRTTYSLKHFYTPGDSSAVLKTLSFQVLVLVVSTTRQRSIN